MEKETNKRKYEAPLLTIVSFKTEVGFAGSNDKLGLTGSGGNKTLEGALMEATGEVQAMTAGSKTTNNH